MSRNQTLDLGANIEAATTSLRPVIWKPPDAMPAANGADGHAEKGCDFFHGQQVSAAQGG